MKGKHKAFAVTHIFTLLLDWLCQMSSKHVIVLVLHHQHCLLDMLQVVEEGVVRLAVPVD